jgi:SPOR domain
MSLTPEVRRSQQPAFRASPSETACAHCHAPLADDQEWCLECGVPRTRIHRAPDWWIPIAIIGGVLTLVLVAFAIALINLSDNANRSPQTPVARTPGAATPAATAAAPIPDWPVGLPGWTVVIARSHSKRSADATARRIIASGRLVGVLNSSEHPSMTPGYQIVYTGRYVSRAQARGVAAKLRRRGDSSARVQKVG